MLAAHMRSSGLCLIAEGAVGGRALVLQHITPGRAEGKGSIDQADVGIGLRKVPELDMGVRHKVLGKEANPVGAGEALTHDLLGFRQATELRQCLNDPE